MFIGVTRVAEALQFFALSTVALRLIALSSKRLCQHAFPDGVCARSSATTGAPAPANEAGRMLGPFALTVRSNDGSLVCRSIFLRPPAVPLESR